MSKWKDGLPPVGEKVELWIYESMWDEVVVIAHDNGDAVVKHQGLGYCAASEKTLRPLKSEADRKRDEAVEEIMKTATVNHPCGGSYGITFAQAEALHDAGYRKITPLTDEQIKEFCSPLLDATEYHRVFEAIKWARSQILGEEL